MTKSLSSSWFWRPSSLVRNLNLKGVYFCLYTVFLLVLILYVTSLSPPFLCLSFPSILLFLSSSLTSDWLIQLKVMHTIYEIYKKVLKICSALHNIKSYTNTTLSNVMRSEDAVRRNPVTASVSDKDVEVMMVKWLHLAGARMVEENDKKMLMKRKELKLTVKPNWNYLHFLQLHDILFTCFYTEVFCKHTHTLSSIWMVAYFCNVIFLHWVWTAFDWQLIFVLFLYFCTVHIFLQWSILHTRTEQPLVAYLHTVVFLH